MRLWRAARTGELLTVTTKIIPPAATLCARQRGRKARVRTALAADGGALRRSREIEARHTCNLAVKQFARIAHASQQQDM